MRVDDYIRKRKESAAAIDVHMGRFASVDKELWKEDKRPVHSKTVVVP